VARREFCPQLLKFRKLNAAFKMVFKVIILFLNAQLKISLKNCKFIQVLQEKYGFWVRNFW